MLLSFVLYTVTLAAVIYLKLLQIKFLSCSLIKLYLLVLVFWLIPRLFILAQLIKVSLFTCKSVAYRGYQTRKLWKTSWAHLPPFFLHAFTQASCMCDVCVILWWILQGEMWLVNKKWCHCYWSLAAFIGYLSQGCARIQVFFQDLVTCINFIFL